MGFTRSTTNTEVHQNMPDYPSGEGYTTAQLKTAFDAPATGLKTDLNGLMTELEDSSSAQSLGASAIAEEDTTDANVQAKLQYLMQSLQGLALGDIPDGTITQAKINATYEGTLAKKDGTLQTGLSAEKLNGKTEAELKTAFLGTPNVTTISFTGLTGPSSQGTTTATETKTYATNGSRYYLMVFSYNACKIGLYDAQSGKYVFATYLGTKPSGDSGHRDQTFAFYTNQFEVNNGFYSDGELARLTTTYSNNTITFTMYKSATTISGGTKYNVPSGTIMVFELGGKVS